MSELQLDLSIFSSFINFTFFTCTLYRFGVITGACKNQITSSSILIKSKTIK